MARMMTFIEYLVHKYKDEIIDNRKVSTEDPREKLGEATPNSLPENRRNKSMSDEAVATKQKA